MVTVEPLMRTEAQQMQIDQIRLDAEMYQARLLANVEQRNQDSANFVGTSMQHVDMPNTKTVEGIGRAVDNWLSYT